MKISFLSIDGIFPAMIAMRLPHNSEGDSDWHNIGPKDLALAQKLIRAGDEHAKVMRGIIVWMQIKAPIYWWRELETYVVGHQRLSCESTMHIDCKGLSGEELQNAKAEIPMGKEQTAIDLFSYQTLRRIYKQRKNHRLREWHTFCKKLEQLPYFEQFIKC